MNRLPPLPTDLKSAHTEIMRLRAQLIRANEKWCNAVMKRELDNRANRGTIRAMKETELMLRERLKDLLKNEEK